ncbi:hypothetical protein MPSEU_000970900 [Mayamaea pseudoterrestris]|nr:hypothetical protein MPSEU_000970900 [Mayamaea pseudoterrestris]
MSFFRSPQYQVHCMQRAVGPSIIFGGAFTAIDVVLQGAKLTPTLAATNIGGIFVYNVIQCPMEAISGRQSAWHNVFAAATLGGAGVHTGKLGIPFVDATFFYRYPSVSPMMAGAAVYGLLGGVLATLGNKPF